MKITNIECVPVQAPGRTLVPILVDTDEGITGIGEAGLQRRTLAIAGAVEHLICIIDLILVDNLY